MRMLHAQRKTLTLPPIKPLLLQNMQHEIAESANKATPCASAPCHQSFERFSVGSNNTSGFEPLSRATQLTIDLQKSIRSFTAVQIRIDRLDRAVNTNLGNLSKLAKNIFWLVYLVDEMNGQLKRD